jgi:hypothetical protein
MPTFTMTRRVRDRAIRTRTAIVFAAVALAALAATTAGAAQRVVLGEYFTNLY